MESEQPLQIQSQESISRFRSLFHRYGTQIASSFAASLGIMTVGTVSTWTSTALPSLKNDPFFSNLTIDEESWIASLVPLGALLSGPVVGASVDQYGRKFTMIVHALLLIVGWIQISFAKSVLVLELGRFVTGLCNGCGILAPVVYISDICESGIRGAMSTLAHILASFGVLLSYVLGSELPWNLSALISAIVPLTYLILVIVLDKESPRFLLDHGKNEQAKASLTYLRTAATEDEIDHELNSITQSLAHEREDSASFRSLIQTGSLRPLGLGLLLMFFQQFCGFNAILYFTVSIFKSSGTTLDPNLSSIWIGVTMVLATPIASIVVDRAGRRILLFVSGGLLAASLAVLGGFFYFKEHNYTNIVNNFGWVPLASVIVYFAAFAIGFASIPWLLIAEIVPNHFVGKAIGICTSAHFLFGFLIAKYYQAIATAIGNSWCFWGFGLITVIGVVFMYFFVPETKLRTLEEIQEQFSKQVLRRASVTGSLNLQQQPSSGTASTSGSLLPSTESSKNYLTFDEK